MSATETKSDRSKSLAIIVSWYISLKVCWQFLDIKKRFSWSHNELEKPSKISAKRLERALRHQLGDFLAATHQREAAAKQNLVNTLTRNNEEHPFAKQIKLLNISEEFW